MDYAEVLKRFKRIKESVPIDEGFVRENDPPLKIQKARDSKISRARERRKTLMRKRKTHPS